MSAPLRLHRVDRTRCFVHEGVGTRPPRASLSPRQDAEPIASAQFNRRELLGRYGEVHDELVGRRVWTLTANRELADVRIRHQASAGHLVHTADPRALFPEGNAELSGSPTRLANDRAPEGVGEVVRARMTGGTRQLVRCHSRLSISRRGGHPWPRCAEDRRGGSARGAALPKRLVSL